MEINKKGWVAKDFVLALLIFSAIFGIFNLMSFELATDYGNSGIYNAEMSAHYDNFSTQKDAIDTMLEESKSEKGMSLKSTVELFFGSTFTIITLIFSSINIVSGQMVNFIADFGVPLVLAKIIFGLLIGSITAIIVLAIVNAVNRMGKI